MRNLISFSFIFIFIVIIIISLFSFDYSYNEKDIFISSSGFAWPIPNFTAISSYFGTRLSPTLHASTFHYGVDIPAKEGTLFIASISGKIVYTGFSGSGGYTIILENSNVRIVYCHASPDFIVRIGENVEQGQVIGQVRSISRL